MALFQQLVVVDFTDIPLARRNVSVRRMVGRNVLAVPLGRRGCVLLEPTHPMGVWIDVGVVRRGRIGTNLVVVGVIRHDGLSRCRLFVFRAMVGASLGSLMNDS